MKLLQGSVSKRVLTFTDSDTPFVAGNVGEDTISVTFDAEWTGLSKVISFANGSKTITCAYADNMAIPHEVLKKGKLLISIEGMNNGTTVLHTAQMKNPLDILNYAPEDGVSPTPATQSILSQLIEQGDECEAIGEAVAAAAVAGDYTGTVAISSVTTDNVPLAQPYVDVIAGGTEQDRTYSFAFHGLKGAGADAIALFEVVSVLPETGLPNKIYLVPRNEADAGDAFDEWAWINNDWEHFGSATIDLSQYSTTSQMNTAIGNAVSSHNSSSAAHNDIRTELADKADADEVMPMCLSGAGAPTTSTVGVVGQTYWDTTNSNLYVCTAVSGGSYAWTITYIKRNIGKEKAGALSIGNANTYACSDSIAIGNYAHTTWPYYSSQVAIGDCAVTDGDCATAVGSKAYAKAGSTALGIGARVNAIGSIQLGRGGHNENNAFYVAFFDASGSPNFKLLDATGLIPPARYCSKQTLTFTAADWDNKSQTVACTGLRVGTDTTQQVTCNIVESDGALLTSMVPLWTCTTAGQLTCTCQKDAPTSDISVVVVMQEV